MIAAALGVFLPSMLGGFLLAGLAWSGRGWMAVGLKAVLGAGLGMGVSSWLYFLRLLALPGQGGYLLLTLAFLGAMIAAAALTKRWPWAGLGWPPRPTVLQAALIILALGALMAAAYNLLINGLILSHGDFDAQMIWNMRARFIFRSGDNWRQAFSPLIDPDFHQDYPLLIPLNVVAGWNTLGSENLRVPLVQALIFGLGAPSMLLLGLAHLRSPGLGALGAAILAVSPLWLLVSGFQTADVPLAFFFLATALLFIIAAREQDAGVFFLAGLAAGLAGWTKNEGLVFVMACTAALFIAIRPTRAGGLFFLSGLALPLVVVAIFKIQFPVPNDVISAQGLENALTRVLDPARYGIITQYLLRDLGQFAGWPPALNIIGVLGAFWLAWRASIIQALRPGWRAVAMVAALQFGAYLAIYIITPRELTWHLMYSLDRLLLQLFPLGLLLVLLNVKTPETLFSRE